MRSFRTASTSRRVVITTALLASAALVLAALHVPGANGAFIAKIANSTNTTATNPWFTCTGYATSTVIGPALFAYPLGDATTLAAADVSGRANVGSYSASGVSVNQTNTGACTRDKTTVATFSGGTGNADTLTSAVSGPVAIAAGPNTFTEEIWFKTTTATGGDLISFGDARTGASGNNDRHLYLDNAGNVVFGVYPGAVVNVVSPGTYRDGNWHFAAATLSSAGMALYVDGVQVATNTGTTTAQAYNGYWRIGYDNTSGWGTTTTPNTYHFIGQLAWASVYSAALTATQIAQQYAAGH